MSRHRAGLPHVRRQRDRLSLQPEAQCRERGHRGFSRRFDQGAPNLGFGLCFRYLHNVHGYVRTHKRVRLIDCELELNLRINKRTVRHEWLDLSIFETIAEARTSANDWLWTCQQ